MKKDHRNIKAKLASWLLELSLKLFPVKEPPPTRIIYTSRNVCHECVTELVNVSKGVWACPHCVHERIVERVSVNNMGWYQTHPGMYAKQWREYKRQEKEVKTMPLLAMPKNIRRR